MSQVLARKYRPRNFSQLIGQQHVARALGNALTRGRLHHAYLFSGTRGVGKTTIARILAKCLNCEIGVTATPCEQCSICLAVNEGRFIDLIEIDAASRTRVEDTRELLDNVAYAPTQGRYKVYLIDEVHMLSTHSFNALLKTLEEPPEHVKFLFATTDPQKLPITIVSRCLQFKLRPLTQPEIADHVQQVLRQEQIPFESSAVWQIADAAQGSVRDALSLTDQAIAYGQGQVNQHDVIDMLGRVDGQVVFDLLAAISQSVSQVTDLLQTIRQQPIDAAHVLEQLIAALHHIALYQVLGSEQLMIGDLQYQSRIQTLAQQIDAQEVQLYYQIAIQGRADLPLALTPEQGFEMCLLRLLAFRPLPPDHYAPDATPPIAESAQQSPVQVSPDSLHMMPTPSIASSIDQAPSHHDIDQSSIESASLPSESTGSLQYAAPQQDGEYDEPQAPLQQINDEHVHMVESGIDQSQLISNHLTSSLSTTPLDLARASYHDVDVDVDHTITASVQASQQVAKGNAITTAMAVVEAKDMQQPTLERQVAIDTPTSDVQESDRVSVVDPRHLLTIASQPLNGQWTAAKWDYWLSQAALSPVIKGVLQHTMMQGTIERVSELHFTTDYQSIINRFTDQIRQQLQVLHPDAELVCRLVDQVQHTPAQLAEQRQQRAYQQADQQIRQHPVINDLIQQFAAHVSDISFKP